MRSAPQALPELNRHTILLAIVFSRAPAVERATFHSKEPFEGRHRCLDPGMLKCAVEVSCGEPMTTAQIVVIIVAVLVIAAIVVWMIRKKERTRKLRAQFGPEYDHAVRWSGNRAKAEEDLVRRQRRMQKVSIQPLAEEDRERFAAQWRETQTRFVDDPTGSIHDADRLLCDLMRVRGYPISDFEHRAEDLSVDYPALVRNYRAAHGISFRLERGEASTEELRQVLVYYRDLFDELLEVHAVGPQGVRR